jgi:hypothetical protein
MKKKLPFEEEMQRKMQDLHAPGEDEAWLKMKQLLDEEENDKPFIFFRTYKFWAAIALITVLTFSAIILIDKNKNQTINTKTETTAKDKNYLNKNISKDTLSVTNLSNTDKKNNKDSFSKSKQNINDVVLHKSVLQNNFSEHKNTQTLRHQSSITKAAAENSGQNFSTIKTKSSTEITDRSALVNKKSVSTQTISNNFSPNKSIDQTQTTDSASAPTAATTSVQSANSQSENENKNIADLNSSQTLNKAITTNKNNNDSTHIIIENSKANFFSDSVKTIIDSLRIAQAKDSSQHITKKDSSATAQKTKKPDSKNKHYFLAAGIQEQQQIPLNGQQISAYNLNGKSNLFDDYIPSIYLHLERDSHWFLEGAFSVIAPEAVQPFMYSKQTDINYSFSTETATMYQLQKTFYSELPLSFNYYILPQWSVGAGMQYNWFYGAVTNRTISESNAQSGTSSTANEIMSIKNYNDSFIYNFKTALIFQTDYNWKRWSFSLRYTDALQPYMTYTLPDGSIINKKNTSLEFLIGYRFFKSKKFKLL